MSGIISLADRWAHILWVITWQVTLIVALLRIVSLLARKSPPAFHYWIWCIVLIRLCLPMNLSFPFSWGGFLNNGAQDSLSAIVNIVNPATGGITSGGKEPIGVNEYQPLAEPDFAPNNNIAYTPNPIRTVIPLGSQISFLWLSFIIVIGAFLGFRIYRMRRFIRDCRDVQKEEWQTLLRQLSARTGVRRPVSLLCMSSLLDAGGPLVAGVFHPKIILPRRMIEEWQLEEIEPVLLHELAHIKRNDPLMNFLQMIVQAVYFFHPLVWYANWKIREARELICDDLAVSLSGSGRRLYGKGILRVIEETRKDYSFVFSGLGMAERHSSLGRRIIRMMDNGYKPKGRMGFLSILMLVATAFLCATIFSQQPATEIKKGDTEKEKIERMIARWNYVNAIPAAEAFLAKATDDHSRAAGHLLLARAYGVKGIEYRDAEARYNGKKHLEQAYALEPSLKGELDMANIRAHLMTYRKGETDCQKAVEEAQKEVEKEPQSAAAHFYLGMLHHLISGREEFLSRLDDRKKEINLAVEEMKKAVQLDPRRYEYWAYYITALDNASRKEEVRKEAERMLQTVDLSSDKIPWSASPPYVVYSSFLPSQEGKEYIRKMALQHPEDADLRLAAARSYSNYKNDDPAKSREMLQSLVDDIAAGKIALPVWRSRVEVSALYVLGHLYFQAGDTKKAFEIYDKVQKLSPDYAGLHGNLGVMYVTMARKAAGKEEKISLLEKAKSEFETATKSLWHDNYDWAKASLEDVEKQLLELGK